VSKARFVGVIEVGKARASVHVVDLDQIGIVASRTRQNAVQRGSPYPHFDTDALWAFFCESLAELSRGQRIDALSVTTHGATAALVDGAGDLALPVMDYEFTGPEVLSAEYDAVRPDFAEGYSPRLPAGLNLGAQLFWQARRFPEAFARTRWILPYPQYWSFRLTGTPAAEMGSLAYHTDLWDFGTDLYSSLVMREGWVERMPEVCRPDTCLGLTSPAVTARCGFTRAIPVFSGIQDANATLLAHLLKREQPFAVVSSQVWVVVSAPGGDLEGLDPSRDTLVSIDAFGRHVPVSRFMGGREWDNLTGGLAVDPSPATVARVLDQKIMLLPSLTEGSGPFQNHHARWTVPRDRLDTETLNVVASFYLALMTAECLRLVGAEGPIVLEGRFAFNTCYGSMLAAATGRKVQPNRRGASGTVVGAALLARMEPPLEPPTEAISPPPPGYAEYAAIWRKRA